MKISKGKIYFNREEFPDLCESDFAYAVIAIMEKFKLINRDQSEWDKDKIIVE